MENVFINFLVDSKLNTPECLALSKWFVRVAYKMPPGRYAEAWLFISFESQDYVFLN